MAARFLLLLGVTSLLALAGCAPSVSPLYRDYDLRPDTLAEDAPAEAVYARLRAALAEAGWNEAEPSAPNVLSTEQRAFGRWGLYEVLVSLDVVPMGDRYVRVQFHPVRHYITGARSKIPYLGSGLRQAILPPLQEAFEAHGLHPIGIPRERDEDQVEGT